MEEKPLHVRVAEALGWIDLRQENGMDRYSWTGWHAPMEVGKRERVPDFEHDWSATGPLIEKYHLHVGEEVFRSDEGVLSSVGWFAGTWESEQGAEPQWDHLIGRGETPLLAVCNLLLELAKAGKL